MKRLDDNVVYVKSFDFALKIISFHKYLCCEHKEYIISKQLLRSGTSIGANIAESTEAQSKKDFSSKMNIALKEAAETRYWLTLLSRSLLITDTTAINTLLNDLCVIIKLLNSIIKTTRNIVQIKIKKVQPDP